MSNPQTALARNASQRRMEQYAGSFITSRYLLSSDRITVKYLRTRPHLGANDPGLLEITSVKDEQGVEIIDLICQQAWAHILSVAWNDVRKREIPVREKMLDTLTLAADDAQTDSDLDTAGDLLANAEREPRWEQL